MEETGLKQTMGVGEAVFTLVGFVIGMAPFIIPAPLLPDAGPGLFVAYLLAGALALLSCLVAAQVGGVFPTSGAGYIGVSHLLHPAFGFLLVWMIMVCMVVGMPILGYGFADYLAYFLPALPRAPVAAAAILAFGLVNLTGVKATVLVQALLVSLLLAVLAVFTLGGLAHMKGELMRPMFPAGAGPILIAAIPAYYSYGGFMAIVEMGDEIKNPARTIPISLALSFAIVLVLYVGVAVALPGLMPYASYHDLKAPLAEASQVFMPKWFSGFLAVSAMLGAAVCINAWFLTQTRDIYALARDRVLPKALAHVNAKHGEPDGAVIFATAISVAGVALGASVEEYATMVVMAMMIIQVMSGVALLRVRGRLPEFYAKSAIQLGPAAIQALGWTFIVLSVAFGIIGAAQSFKATAAIFALLAVGVVYYFFRARFLATQGFEMRESIDRDIARLRERHGLGKR